MSDAAKIDDGSPAFPRPDLVNLNPQSEDYGTIYGSGGLTLRDWFAGQALIGMKIPPNCVAGSPSCDYAERAYRIADAMLAKRKRS